MNWSSWSEFLAMGGYGLYVWGSFAMCALVLTLEVGLLSARRRAALQQDDAEAIDNTGVGAS
ncbi:heme exporter protein CcmD [Comamonadaceae bacterium G21597-S1]|nr:heme exporter protein CcmD [Comamonadaceae bacterium G21597-S1]